MFTVFMASCSDKPSAPEATTAPTPPPNLVPVVALTGPEAVGEGYEATWTGTAADPEGLLAQVIVDFADGSAPASVVISSDGRFAASHRFAQDGIRVVRATARDAAGNEATARHQVLTTPRKVIIVAGVESESRCKGGLAPAWVNTLLQGTDLSNFASFGGGDVLSFSYSGRYCDGGSGTNGAGADYRAGDTCDGVAGENGAANRLRLLIDALAPARVTIVGHSMGGLVATYLAGSDPQWAAEHVASIVAFDSPLQGVPRINLELLRLSSMNGGCSWNSASMRDLGDGGNDVLDVAARASAITPVYTVDATDKDGPFGGIRQAVPGSRTHLEGETASFRVSSGHFDSWWMEASGPGDRRAQRLALGCGIAMLASADCEAERW